MSKRLLTSAAVLSLLAAVGLSCGDDETDLARVFLAVEPARLDFELDEPGIDARTLRLSSGGRAPLVVSQVEVLGAPAGVFRFEAELPIEILPGTHREVQVLFVPTQDGITQGVLRIRSNADNAPERDVALSGRLRDVTHVPPDGGVDEPDAGVDEPDAGSDEPDAGVDEPDAGVDEPDAGVDEPDAGTVVPGDACVIRVSGISEVGTTTDGVNDLAIATGGGKIVVGWWTDKRSLQVRELDANGGATGPSRAVFSGTSQSRHPLEYLAAAGDEAGVVFFVSEESNLNAKVHEVDLRGATPVATQLDLLTTNQRPESMAATSSRGGILGLWRQKAQFSEVTNPHELVGLRVGGAAPFELKRLLTLQRTDSTKNPNGNSSQFTAAPLGDDVIVAWQGQVGSISPISVGRLDGDGVLVDGSVKLVSHGGTGVTNVLPQVVSTPAGLAVAWTQTSSNVRRAVVAELDEALDSRGDIVLGDLGPTSVTTGSVAAAAKGEVVLVGWTRYTASGTTPVKQGLSFSGIDRRTGEVLATVDVPRTEIAAYADHLAIAPTAGAGWIAAWVETGGRVSVAQVTCEE